MSQLDFETVSYVDEYVANKALRRNRQADEYEDEEMREDARAALESLKRRRMLGRPDSIARTEVFLPFDTSEGHRSSIAAAAVANHVVVCVTSGLVLHICDQIGNVNSQSIDLGEVIRTGTAGSSGKGKKGKDKKRGLGATGAASADKVGKLMIDPLGRHVFVSLDNRPVLIYILLKAGSAKPVYKNVIDLSEAAGDASRVTVDDENLAASVWAIGFNTLNTFEATTGDILMGTRQGAQLWTGRFENTGANAVKRVHVISGERQAIVGISVERHRDAAHDRQRAITVCTPQRIYGFVGYGSFESILATFAVDRIGAPSNAMPSLTPSAPTPAVGRRNTVATQQTAANADDDADSAAAEGESIQPIVVQLPTPKTGTTGPLLNVASCATYVPLRYTRDFIPDSFVTLHPGGISLGRLVDVAEPERQEALVDGEPLIVLHTNIAADELEHAVTGVPPPTTPATPADFGATLGSPPSALKLKKGGAAEGPATPKIVSLSANQFWIFLATEEAVFALLHPACLPWAPTRFAPSSKDVTGGAGSPVRSTMGFSSTLRNFGMGQSLAAPLIPSSTSNMSFGGAGADGEFDSASFARPGAPSGAGIAMTTCSSESGAGGGPGGAGGGGGANLDETNVEDLYTGLDYATLNPVPTAVTHRDVNNRTIAKFALSAESRELVSRARAAVGVMTDPMNGKTYMYTPLHIYELALPRVRPAMIPLFGDIAKSTEKLYRRTATSSANAKSASRVLTSTRGAVPKLLERKRRIADVVVRRLQLAADAAFKAARFISSQSPVDDANVKLAAAKSAFQGRRFIEAAAMFAECDNVSPTTVILQFAGAAHAGEPDVMVGLESFVCRRIRRWVSQRQSWMESSAQIFCLSHFLVLLLVGRCNALNSLKQTESLLARRGDVTRAALEEDAARRRAAAIFGSAFAHAAHMHRQNPAAGTAGLGDDGVRLGESAASPVASPARQHGETDGALAVGSVGSSGLQQRSRDLAHLSEAAAIASDFSTEPARAAVRQINENLRRSVVSALAGGADRGATVAKSDGAIDKAVIVAEASLAATLMELGETLDFKLIQDRLLATANPSLLAVVCTLLHRFDDVMRYLVLLRDYRSAVRLLVKYCGEPLFAPLWKRHIPTLFQHYPVTIVRRGLIPMGTAIGLHPFDFSSAFAAYIPSQHNEKILADDDTDVALKLGGQDDDSIRFQGNVVVEYLLHCVNVEGRAERNVCDWLVVVLAQHARDTALLSKANPQLVAEAEGQLLSFITGVPSFTVTFALRECQRTSQWRACVRLHAQLQQYPEAVRLALKIPDLELAKAVVNDIENDRPMQEQLWKAIAKYVVSQQGGPKNSLMLLRETRLLSMNDVLPHFTDEVMIADFREELVGSVNRFDGSMKDTARAVSKRQELAVAISADIGRERNRPVIMRASTRCEQCKQPALSRDYVYFGGCGHAFHVQCFNDASMREYGGAAEAECFLCSPATLHVNLNAPIATRSAFKLSL